MSGMAIFDDVNAKSCVILPKTAGCGLKVDNLAPTFGWHDLKGMLRPDVSGADAPITGVFLTPVRAYYFDSGDKMDCEYHIPHDYVPGSDLYIHVHWSHDAATSITGNVSFVMSSVYARRTIGTNYMFTDPATDVKTHTITYATTSLATTPAYVHRVDEIQITGASDSATQYARSTIEVDGLMLVHVTCPTIPTMVGNPVANQNRIPILHVDLHYQSTGIGTKSSGGSYYA